MTKEKSQKSASLRIAFVIVCLSFLVLIVNENMTINELKKEQAVYMARVEAVDREIERVMAEFEKPLTDETMRQLARDSLGYYMINEIIYEVS
ncbi:MAG: septum formation initiator family protein [Clostridia bacterium]|nr:septum formation initiator family protein [Clostridia bacterium]